MDFRRVRKFAEYELEVEERGNCEGMFEVGGEVLGLVLEGEDEVF